MTYIAPVCFSSFDSCSEMPFTVEMERETRSSNSVDRISRGIKSIRLNESLSRRLFRLGSISNQSNETRISLVRECYQFRLYRRQDDKTPIAKGGVVLVASSHGAVSNAIFRMSTDAITGLPESRTEIPARRLCSSGGVLRCQDFNAAPQQKMKYNPCMQFRLAYIVTE